MDVPAWFAAGLVVAGLATGSGVRAQSGDPPAFDRMVVFGDSLSDNGNAGRFSNGPVWVERIAAQISLPLEPSRSGGTNYAVGGARLDPASGPDRLPAQADRFLRERGSEPEGRTLFVVYGGGNDLLAAVGAPDGEARVDVAAAALRGIVADLVAIGATDILVPNLPNVGITPAVRSYGGAAVADADRLSRRFNAAVDRGLAEIDAAADLHLYRLDVYAMAERAMEDPHAFGFTDVTRPCQGLTDCDGHLFWDSIHPTTQAHARLADAALQLVGGEAPVR